MCSVLTLADLRRKIPKLFAGITDESKIVVGLALYSSLLMGGQNLATKRFFILISDLIG